MTPTEKYNQLQNITEQLCGILCDAIITPVAKKQFEVDRGQPVNQVLPDRTENYEFSSHGFQALVVPDERQVTNHAFKSTSISTSGLIREIDQLDAIISTAESLWVDNFGEVKPTRHQPDHPGPFPLDTTEGLRQIEQAHSLYDTLIETKSLSVVAEAARNENYPLLADMFGTTENDILTPGGTDLSVLRLNDTVHVPYNDGSLAVLRPTDRTPGRRNLMPGVIIGHDDTPTGIFAHVTDVTNLAPGQATTRDAITDAMGFDSELDPWDTPETLEAPTGHRIRLQGDLRVERTGDLDGFTSELARNTRIDEYQALIDAALEDVPAFTDPMILRGEFTVTEVFDISVSPSGDPILDPSNPDEEIQLIACLSILDELEIGPAEKYDIDNLNLGESEADIPWLQHPTEEAAQRGLEEVQTTFETITSQHQDTIEAQAQELATEAEAALDVPQQVNLPVDNHMTFVKEGFAPDTDTAPVPVAVPEETTLHIIHDEHNTVTTTIQSGVYRFSLLPRGLQPEDTRPDWPEP